MAAREVTLNGRPAYVAGDPDDPRFALVTDAETGLSAQWSWSAVARVVARDGAFRS